MTNNIVLYINIFIILLKIIKNTWILHLRLEREVISSLQQRLMIEEIKTDSKSI
jgi:hypothetical protein